MEHLWAPWRNLYVKDSQEKRGEYFCRIAQGTDDEGHFVLARGKSCFAILNLYPYNTGHLMVIPYRETGALEDLSDDETARTDDHAQAHEGGRHRGVSPRRDSTSASTSARPPARASTQHLHIHLVPRWRSDANFMTTTAETRVHPTDLASVYAAIKKQL